MPEPISDFLFCEAVEFAVLPWQLDEMDIETFAFWSQVIGTYRDEKSKRELERQKRETPAARKR